MCVSFCWSSFLMSCSSSVVACFVCSVFSSQQLQCTQMSWHCSTEHSKTEREKERARALSSFHLQRKWVLAQCISICALFFLRHSSFILNLHFICWHLVPQQQQQSLFECFHRSSYTFPSSLHFCSLFLFPFFVVAIFIRWHTLHHHHHPLTLRANAVILLLFELSGWKVQRTTEHIKTYIVQPTATNATSPFAERL